MYIIFTEKNLLEKKTLVFRDFHKIEWVPSVPAAASFSRFLAPWCLALLASECTSALVSLPLAHLCLRSLVNGSSSLAGGSGIDSSSDDRRSMRLELPAEFLDVGPSCGSSSDDSASRLFLDPILTANPHSSISHRHRHSLIALDNLSQSMSFRVHRLRLPRMQHRYRMIYSVYIYIVYIRCTRLHRTRNWYDGM